MEHEVRTLVGQRVFAITLGYENPIDHDDLRHDSVMAGKSTLNRLELSLAESTPYHRTSHDLAAVEAGFVDLFVEAHAAVPSEIVLDLDATDDPLHGYQEGHLSLLLRHLLLSAAIRLLWPVRRCKDFLWTTLRQGQSAFRGDLAEA